MKFKISVFSDVTEKKKVIIESMIGKIKRGQSISSNDFSLQGFNSLGFGQQFYNLFLSECGYVEEKIKLLDVEFGHQIYNM